MDSLFRLTVSSLPPANEVWGKVICLHACVCPQWGEGVPAPGGWGDGGVLYMVPGSASSQGGAWSWGVVHGPVGVDGPRGCMVLAGCIVLGGRMVPEGTWSWGVHGPGGCRVLKGVHGPGGMPGGDTPLTATAVGGTHPTGMHSCCKL